jgi:Fe2+ or Zn2+ uptake regulation protein
MLRRSKQKDSILRLVKETNSHPTAEWIYEQVKKEIPHISLGTVYRNLKLLKQEGEISELGLSGTLRFDGKTENHYHFRCVKCGHILDVDEPVHKEIDEQVANRKGLKISYHVLEFRGLCRDCQH